MSFEYNSATISARKLTIGDSDDIGDLLAKLPEERRTLRVYRFIEFSVAAEVRGADRPVPAIDASSTALDIEAAYAEWRKLPRKFLTDWQSELTTAEGNPKA